MSQITTKNVLKPLTTETNSTGLKIIMNNVVSSVGIKSYLMKRPLKRRVKQLKGMLRSKGP